MLIYPYRSQKYIAIRLDRFQIIRNTSLSNTLIYTVESLLSDLGSFFPKIVFLSSVLTLKIVHNAMPRLWTWNMTLDLISMYSCLCTLNAVFVSLV